MRYCLVNTTTGKIGIYGETVKESTAVDKATFAGPDWEARFDHPFGIDPRVTYYNNGEYVARPVTPEPSATYDLTQLPSGTTVYVRNEAGDELTIVDLTEDLLLTDPGSYYIEVLPPFPWTEIRTTVEVT